MMNRLVTLFAFLFLLATVPLLAQTATGPGMWTVGAGLEGGVPVGDFSNVSNFGIGGLATAGYNGIDPNFTVTFSLGYIHFSGKDITDAGTGGTISTSENVVPILVGGKYYFMPGDTRVYGQVNLGLYALSASGTEKVNGVEFSSSASTTKFGFSPVLGADFKAGDNMWVDAHANYTVVSTEGSTTSWVGFGIGLLFDLP